MNMTKLFPSSRMTKSAVIPAVESVWKDKNGIPHHVINATEHRVLANKRGKPVDMPTMDWLDSMVEMKTDFF